MPDNIEAFPSPPREDMVFRGCRMINENLDDSTIHVFRSTVINWLTSPQMLCVLPNDELHYLAQVIHDEQTFRLSERKLSWSK